MSEQVSDNQTAAPFARPPTGELFKRAVSAVVLGGIGIGATVAGVWPLAIVVSAVSVVLAWEWGRLVRNAEFDDLLFWHVGAVLLAIAFAAAALPAYGLLILAAGTLAIAVRRHREYHKLSALGVPYVGIAALGIVWLRESEYGAAAILLVFACVWAHDSFAMLVGRAVGGPRLWPSISPKKTWSGAVGGLLAAVLVATAGHMVLPGTSLAWLAALGFILGLAALTGDLAESGLKRLGRVKNASGLIPGHGGFLDRMDGAIASFAIACLIALCVNPELPARALLQGH